MVTIGDVLAVIGILTLSVLSLWALVLAMSLLFRERTAIARERIEHSPGKVTFWGAVITLVLGVIVGALLNQPNGLLKLIGWIIYLLVLMTTAVGFSGIAQLVAQRLSHVEPSLTPYAALSRGALLCVLAALLPILGWFFVGPLLAFASLGAGIGALVTRSPALAPPQPVNTAAP